MKHLLKRYLKLDKFDDYIIDVFNRRFIEYNEALDSLYIAKVVRSSQKMLEGLSIIRSILNYLLLKSCTAR